MRTPGTYISAIAHVGLIGWLILGWGFDAEPLPIDPIPFTTVSGEEFAEMMAARTPEPGTADPATPVPPVVNEAPPPPPAPVETPTPAPTPPAVEQPVAETPPPPPPAPLETEATDEPPVEPAPPPPPPPTPDVAPSARPAPAQVERVAPVPSAPPPPEAEVADVVQEEVVIDDAAEPEIVEEAVEATAPEEAATELVIAEEPPSGAVETSIRPSARPSRPTPPTPAVEPAPEPETQAAEAPQEPAAAEPEPAVDEDAVAAALAAALSSEPAPQAAAAPAVAAGPPMTGSERDSFRVAVNRCWNVDPGSVAARVTVEVGFSLDRSGQVQGDVQLLSSDGDQSATNTAFEAARRAILRCQSGGYQLPADKYDQWKDVVITFDPSGMRLR